MKVFSLVRIILVNWVVLALVYLAELDLAFRNSYAGSLNFAPSSGYSVLTHVFTMTGRGITLVSPLTLDWVQVLIIALLAVDISYVARFLRTSRTGPSGRDSIL